MCFHCFEIDEDLLCTQYEQFSFRRGLVTWKDAMYNCSRRILSWSGEAVCIRCNPEAMVTFLNSNRNCWIIQIMPPLIQMTRSFEPHRKVSLKRHFYHVCWLCLNEEVLFWSPVSLQAFDKTQTTIARLILSLLGDEDWLVVEGAAPTTSTFGGQQQAGM